ncbi:MAG TPA: aldo/keto reductase [Thermoanaerobaculia bacterium]|nr:aldo/keto reductase [Thermoanaerobaculia bacterium]
MKTIRFGRTNVEVPTVSLGTWGQGGPNTVAGNSVGWSGNDDQLASEALRRAWEVGITHWDTADVYGNGHAEKLIGAVWEIVPRDEIFLATKVGWDPGPYGHFYDPRQIRSQMERSLQNLKIDHVDLYYLHHCDFGPADEYFDDALATVRKLHEEGKTRFLGLSDWDSSKIMRFIDRVDPDVVQPYRNVLDDTYESSGLKAWVDENDAGVAFFSPIKHGLLLGKYETPVTFPEGDFRRGIAEFGDAAALRRMVAARKEIETRFAADPQPVLRALLGTLLTDVPTGCVLLGQRTPRHVEAASHVGGPLTHSDASWVRSLYQ